MYTYVYMCLYMYIYIYTIYVCIYIYIYMYPKSPVAKYFRFLVPESFEGMVFQPETSNTGYLDPLGVRTHINISYSPYHGYQGHIEGGHGIKLCLINIHVLLGLPDNIDRSSYTCRPVVGHPVSGLQDPATIHLGWYKPIRPLPRSRVTPHDI